MTLKNKIILIAEDEQFLQKIMAQKLTALGAKVLTASNGQEAVEIIRKETPDLVLLDLMMPIQNGFDVLKITKADEKLKNIPIIILSNLEQDTDRAHCKELGAVDYLIKSNVPLKDITTLVISYLEKNETK
ncbi:response regulator [Candidatus Peregrinibacteria bacterium CG11_big_fil_rev_8_21_14_0_20_41_10]|nr:MAG: response regulator [Candidatus Peregrinibacteria bacterium CG11_big_fil_rev_8_21_14_0_20_41_10]PIZ76903.1 MAG: response regulator [Candidatus Peregrinibacteria bacterium CG_4_10_14_0_2_um_filter_41_8]PJC37809.1 MAG: response regulator [Candidatus Peregrinibacteria bacterium CG_4_9_14_0_2_um_filter_41_14]